MSIVCLTAAVFLALPAVLAAEAKEPASAVEVVADSSTPVPTARSGAGYRYQKGGWTYVHLQGPPAEVGYQHGYLLSAEIEDMYQVLKLENTHETKRNWAFFREASRKMLWSHIDSEYQQELEGIAKGVQAKGAKLDVWDIVAMVAHAGHPVERTFWQRPS